MCHLNEEGQPKNKSEQGGDYLETPEISFPETLKGLFRLFPDSEDPDLKGRPAELQKNNPDPVKSAVQSENPITETEGNEIIKQLLAQDFYVKYLESGPSFDGKSFKIVITTPRSMDKTQQLAEFMAVRSFSAVNKEAFCTLFYTRSLRKVA
ncbi:MAG: hypothetical protein QXU18_02335 [Thermoplasmatales archaeon]